MSSVFIIVESIVVIGVVGVVGVDDVVDAGVDASADADADAGADSDVDSVYISLTSAVLPRNLVYYGLKLLRYTSPEKL